MYASFVTYLTGRFVKFLEAMFQFLRDGTLNLYLFNGEKVVIEDTVSVVSREKWEPRSAPEVVVEIRDLDIDFSSFNMNLASYSDDMVRRNYLGIVNGSLDISCLHSTEPSARLLTDVVAMFFCIPDTLAYFQQHGIRFSDMPSFRGIDEIAPAGQDYKIFVGSLSIPFSTEWQFTEEAVDLINQLVITIDLESPREGIVVPVKTDPKVESR